VPPSASSTEAYPVVSSRRCCDVNSLCVSQDFCMQYH
jgi:hypothetical protein